MLTYAAARYKSLQSAFKRFDEDKDGFISKTEFRQVLSLLALLVQKYKC